MDTANAVSAPILATESTYDCVTSAERKRPVLSISELSLMYSINSIVDYIAAHGFKRAALQFPDDELEDAVFVASSIESRAQDLDLKIRVFILADTSFSPCCVDEIAAEHVGADVLFHFGNACLNSVRSLPVVYVTDQSVNTDVLATKLRNEPEGTVLYVDAELTPTALVLAEELPQLSVSLPAPGPRFIPHIDLPVRNESDLLFKRTLPNDIEINGSVIYITREPSESILLNLTTKFENLRVINTNGDELNVTSVLRRRYRAVQQARAAGTIGILINTLSLRLLQEVLDRLKHWISDAGKKYYLFVVGKPNVPKLANFEAIDIWVVLGCPMGGLVINNHDHYYKPIVTPYELHMALTDGWTGKWEISFEDLLAEPSAVSDSKRDNEKSDEPLWDPVSGRLVSNSAPLRLQRLNFNDDACLQKTTNAVTILSTVSTAAEHLMSREWRGLGTDHHQFKKNEEFAELKTGRIGIARDYSEWNG